MMSIWRNWLPCWGTFLVQMTIFGIHNNFGLIYHQLIIEFNESAAETGKSIRDIYSRRPLLQTFLFYYFYLCIFIQDDDNPRRVN